MQDIKGVRHFVLPYPAIFDTRKFIKMNRVDKVLIAVVFITRLMGYTLATRVKEETVVPWITLAVSLIGDVALGVWISRHWRTLSSEQLRQLLPTDTLAVPAPSVKVQTRETAV